MLPYWKYPDCLPCELLREKAQKTWQNSVLDEFVYLDKSVQVTLDPLALVPKNYILGDYWIDGELVLESKGNTYHLLFVAIRDVGLPQPFRMRPPDKSSLPMNGYPPVLVEINETVKTRQKVGCGLRSKVWLKTLDDDLCGGWDAIGLSGKVFPSLTVKRFLENRKLGLLGITASNRRPGKHGIVEGRTNTANGISKSKRHRNGRVVPLKPDDVASILSVIFTKDGMRVGIRERIDIRSM